MADRVSFFLSPCGPKTKIFLGPPQHKYYCSFSTSKNKPLIILLLKIDGDLLNTEQLLIFAFKQSSKIAHLSDKNISNISTKALQKRTPIKNVQYVSEQCQNRIIFYQPMKLNLMWQESLRITFLKVSLFRDNSTT